MYTFAFDLGRVLFDFDFNIALDKMKSKLNSSPEQIIEELFYKDFGTDFEKGLISSYEFYLKFKNSFNADIAYSEFTDIWCDIFSANTEVIALAKKLKKAYPIYLISNINKLHFEFLYQKHSDVFSLFNELILSYKVKSVKPEKKIYEYLKTICENNFENIIYIDDRQDLIAAAKKFNLKCIQFIDIHQLLLDLKNLGISIGESGASLL